MVTPQEIELLATLLEEKANLSQLTTIWVNDLMTRLRAMTMFAQVENLPENPPEK